LRAAAYLLVSGRVQGVGFRYSCREAAEALGVVGWVRNLPDGRVELFVEGEPSAVERFVEWCQRGPPGARVDDLRTEPGTPEGRTAFTVERTPR
jgi:acylphosphatase